VTKGVLVAILMAVNFIVVPLFASLFVLFDGIALVIAIAIVALVTVMIIHWVIELRRRP
jgi:uncharacterized membrane protein YbhN (UPF0104 family)